ncbi:methyltransferase [bacterium]|nr:methyltransferase [bacterium]
MINQFQLSELEFLLLQEFIHERFGIFFKGEKRSYINMKISPRLVANGFRSFNEYINFLKYGQGNSRELSTMISQLTNNETYFFREIPQLDIFKEKLLPELREKRIIKDDKRIRVLSAGCSTGEEVYTLAMLTYDTGIFLGGWDIKITGMDISEKAVETARQGLYYERSLRMTDPKYRERFFTPLEGTYIIKNNIKDMASFMTGNIISPLPSLSYDIIFCRNVLIYFSEAKIKTAISNFYNALRPGGYLLLGHSESLTGIFDKFEIKRFPQALIYKKGEPVSANEPAPEKEGVFAHAGK